MSFLVDIGGCGCVDHALDGLNKALTDEDGRGHDIWAPHENPLIRELVEQFTARGLAVHARLSEELGRWLRGEYRVSGPAPGTAPGLSNGWTAAQLDFVRIYLSTLRHPTLDDWSLLVDYLFARYAPHGDLVDAADWLGAKAGVLGRVQSHLAGVVDATALLAALPSATSDLVHAFAVSDAARVVLDYGRVNTGELIVAATDRFRRAVKGEILTHQAAVMTGAPVEPLEQRLFDRFADANRDWRRIAVTEAGEMANQGIVASLPPGSKVRRIEMYHGACAWCKKIDGRVMRVVAADDPNRDGETDVWPGKTNVGRSVSPRKFVDGELVPRTASELYWVAAGTQHPHCFLSPSVPVYTSKGWKRISTVRVGDSVLTHRGRFRDVNWVLDGVRHTGKAIRLRVASKGKNVSWISEMTPEHPVLIEGGGWRPVGDVKVGDRLVALAKKCPTCGDVFVNAKHPRGVYCSNQCIPKTGENQYSTDDESALARARAATAEGNRRRLSALTVEQRRALTANGRAVMDARGYGHLQTHEARAKSAKAAAANNYKPSAAELSIAEKLGILGLSPVLQHRVDKAVRHGKSMYWWIDIAIPEQRIAVEIDGEPWHGRLSGNRDAARDADLEQSGWSVLRFPADVAKANPARVAEEVARVAMNHDGLYQFGALDVVEVHVRDVSGVKLYNFGVDEDESYVIGRGVVVHNCRGRWVPVADPEPGHDPVFAEWLRARMAR